LVTYQRDCLFGDLVGGEMQLSVLGKIIHDEWMRSIGIRMEIRLNEDEFVVMPNHLHGIVWIVTADGIQLVGADGVRPEGVRPMIRVRPEGVRPMIRVRPDGVHPNGVCPDGVRPGDVRPYGIRPNKGASIAPLQRKPRSISSFVAGFKAAVTSRAGNELNITGIWQRNYYDHIIRDEQDFWNIWDYIDTNPLHWQEDQLHPSLIITGAGLSPQQMK
jgi:REP element-mobilizing transposase RayT